MSNGFIPPSGLHDPTCEFLCKNVLTTCAHTCKVCDAKRKTDAVQPAQRAPNPMECLVDAQSESGAATLLKVEQIVESITDLSAREWAILAVLCADQAGLGVTGQRQLSSTLQRVTDTGFPTL